MQDSESSSSESVGTRIFGSGLDLRLASTMSEGIEFELLPKSALVCRPGGIPKRTRFTYDCNFYKKPAIRNVSMQWTEKIWIVLDQLQIFAILWVTQCADAERRFPFSWCIQTMWSPYVNADLNAVWSFEFIALNASTSLTQEPSRIYLNGPVKIWIFFSAPAVLLLSFVVYVIFIRRALKQCLGLRSWIIPPIERLYLLLLYYIYLPWQLIVSRYTLCVEMQALQTWQLLYTCDTYTTFQMLCQLKASCKVNQDDLFMFGIAGALVIVFAFGLPVVLWLQIRKGLVFQGWKQHDRWLRAIETEYMVEASGFWSHSHYPLHSSMHRPWAMLLPFSLLQKLALVWLLAVMHDVSNGVIIRDLIVMILLSFHLAALSAWPSFRLRSSQQFAQLLMAGNVVSAGVRALMSTGFTSNVFLLLGILLPAHHALAILLSVLAVSYHFLAGERWPVSAASLRDRDESVQRKLARRSDSAWSRSVEASPRHMPGALVSSTPSPPRIGFGTGAGEIPPLAHQPYGSGDVDDGPGGGGYREAEGSLGRSAGPGRWQDRWAGGTGDGVRGMLEAARAALMEEELRPAGFFRVQRTRDRIAVLEALLAAARRAAHGLEYAVEDVLHDTVCAHNAAVARFRREFPTCRWAGLADHPRLAPLLPSFRAALDARDRALLLAPRRTRRVLARLAALRAFVWLRVVAALRRSIRLRALLVPSPPARPDPAGLPRPWRAGPGPAAHRRSAAKAQPGGGCA
jgi:hypothetical protein